MAYFGIISMIFGLVFLIPNMRASPILPDKGKSKDEFIATYKSLKKPLKDILDTTRNTMIVFAKERNIKAVTSQQDLVSKCERHFGESRSQANQNSIISAMKIYQELIKTTQHMQLCESKINQGGCTTFVKDFRIIEFKMRDFVETKLRNAARDVVPTVLKKLVPPYSVGDVHLCEETNLKVSQVNKENLAKLNAILFCSDQFMKYGIIPFAGKDEFMEKMSGGQLTAVAGRSKEEGIKSMVVPEEELTRGTGALKERASAGHRNVEDIGASSTEKGWEEEVQGEGLQSSEEPIGEQVNRDSSVEEFRPQAVKSEKEMEGQQGSTESLVPKGTVPEVETQRKQQQEHGWEEGQQNDDRHSTQDEQSGKKIEQEGWSEKAQSEENASRREGAGNFNEEPTEATRHGAGYGVSSSKERGTEPSFYEEGQHMHGEEGR